MGCFSGCLMSSARDQKLFCEVCSAFNCSFDEFVGERVVSPSYSSAILAPPPAASFRWHLIWLGEGKHLSTGEGLFSGQVSTGEGLVPKLVVAKGRLVSWAGYCRLWSGFHFCT